MALTFLSRKFCKTIFFVMSAHYIFFQISYKLIKSSWNNPGETLCNASGGDLAPSLDGDGAGPGTTCLLLTRKIFPHFTHVIHSLPVGFRSAFQQIVYEFPYTLRHKVVSWGSVYFFRRRSCNFLLAWLYSSCLSNCQKYLWQNYLGTDLVPHSA